MLLLRMVALDLVHDCWPAQRHERSLRSLYCCSDGVRGRGVLVTYLSHMASFHSTNGSHHQTMGSNT
jgi:hypothetical protein